MRNLDPNYHRVARRRNVVASCLEKAKRLFPGQELSFCGLEENWDDCLSGYRDSDTGEIIFLLNFNIGKASRAVEARVNTHPITEYGRGLKEPMLKEAAINTVDWIESGQPWDERRYQK